MNETHLVCSLRAVELAGLEALLLLGLVCVHLGVGDAGLLPGAADTSTLDEGQPDATESGKAYVAKARGQDQVEGLEGVDGGHDGCRYGEDGDTVKDEWWKRDKS